MNILPLKSAISLAALLLCAGSAAAQTNITLPHNGEGRLEATDPATAEGERYDDHVIRLAAGQRVRLSAASETFDTILQVYQAGSMGQPIAENDDAGDALNSRMTFTAPGAGNYVVRVQSFPESGMGVYRLTAETAPPLPAPVTVPTATEQGEWRVFRGTLQAGDGEIDGRRVDDYQITLRAGETVILRLDTDAFDPIVMLMPVGDREGSPLEKDDDTGAGLNALLGFTSEAADHYIVRVTGFSENSEGAYTLRIGN